jgi:FtsH-binding integral membrane protein
MAKVYGVMALALLWTALVMATTLTHPFFAPLFDDVRASMAWICWLYFLVGWLMLIAWTRWSLSIFAAFCFLYTIGMGLLLALLFTFFTEQSIARVFLLSAGMFGLMSLYGYTTQQNLATIRNIGLMLLCGAVLVALGRLLYPSPTGWWVLEGGGIVLFAFMPAMVNQHIKEVYLEDPTSADAKTVLWGGMLLYATFLVLFLELLRLFGERE